MKRWQRTLLAALPCGLMLSAACYVMSLNRLTADLHQQLQAPLTERIIRSGVNSHDLHKVNQYLQTRINEDLARLTPNSPLSPIGQCQAALIQLRGTPFPLSFSPQRHLQLNWSLPERDESLTLGLRCHPQWWQLSLPALILLGAALLASVVQPPLSPLQQRCLSRMKSQGTGHTQALAAVKLVPGLNPCQRKALAVLLNHDTVQLQQALTILASGGLADDQSLAWLPVALAQHPDNLGAALTLCNAPAQLSFQPDTNTIVVHGVAIRLPATPFMYYLWYARLRKLADADGGWFVNPPSNRPDRRHDQELIELMLDHGGHHKAINDLSEKGLRAKTLDQNRSKVKDELVQALGEALAQPFLFEAERDLQTGRSKYRLALAPAQITLPANTRADRQK